MLNIDLKLDYKDNNDGRVHTNGEKFNQNIYGKINLQKAKDEGKKHKIHRIKKKIQTDLCMQPTDFSSYQYSAVKSYCSWRHVRRQYTKTTTFSNHPKNYKVQHRLRGNVFLMGIYENWLFQIVTALFLLAKWIHRQSSSDSKYFPFSDNTKWWKPLEHHLLPTILGYKCSFMPSELKNFPPHAP